MGLQLACCWPGLPLSDHHWRAHVTKRSMPSSASICESCSNMLLSQLCRLRAEVIAARVVWIRSAAERHEPVTMHARPSLSNRPRFLLGLAVIEVEVKAFRLDGVVKTKRRRLHWHVNRAKSQQLISAFILSKVDFGLLSCVVHRVRVSVQQLQNCGVGTRRKSANEPFRTGLPNTSSSCRHHSGRRVCGLTLNVA